jgi:hypothetical protein
MAKLSIVILEPRCKKPKKELTTKGKHSIVHFRTLPSHSNDETRNVFALNTLDMA